MEGTYKKTFLDKVIARLDFAAVLPGVEESLPTPVVEIAIKRFPIVEPKGFTAGKIKITKEGSVSGEEMATGKVWYYHGKNREKTLCIAPGWMFIVYTKYESFEALKTDFLEVVDTLFKCYGQDVVVKRLGLRYINKVHFDEGEPTRWDKYIDSNLLQIFKVAEDKTKICRAFHNLELNYGDMNLRFQYGMHNPDYPAPIRSKDFTLDFDAYYQGLQNKDEIENNLLRFHNEIKRFFEKFITGKLREVMNK